MATVVALADRQAQTPRRSLNGPVEAKILLFTGVRYERLDGGPTPGAGVAAPHATKKH